MNNKFELENKKEEQHLEDLGLYEKIILDL